MPTWVDPTLKIVGAAASIVDALRGVPKDDRAQRAALRRLRLEQWIAERSKERRR